MSDFLPEKGSVELSFYESHAEHLMCDRLFAAPLQLLIYEAMWREGAGLSKVLGPSLGQCPRLVLRAGLCRAKISQELTCLRGPRETRQGLTSSQDSSQQDSSQQRQKSEVTTASNLGLSS